MGLFSGISNALGLGGAASVQNPVTGAQIGQSYANTQTGLQQQQDLLKALQAQNGIQNQGNVFNQQQQLANTLGQQAQGQGPNPALQQFQNATGQNVAQQAALAAGQRGASQNVGLMARQVGQQGANIQQQAVGQGATLQAQQQLAAQQALQQQQGMLANTAGQQVGEQQGAANAYSQGSLNQQGNLLGAQAAYNQAAIANQQLSNQGAGAILSGLSSAGAAFAGSPKAGAAPAGKAKGGMIEDPHLHAIASIYHPHMVSQPELQSAGGHVEGKAQVKGDSYRNDTVPTMLSPGEIVIPRSVAQSQNPVEESANFVAEKLKEKGDHHGDFHEALKKAISGRVKK